MITCARCGDTFAWSPTDTVTSACPFCSKFYGEYHPDTELTRLRAVLEAAKACQAIHTLYTTCEVCDHTRGVAGEACLDVCPGRRLREAIAACDSHG